MEASSGVGTPALSSSCLTPTLIGLKAIDAGSRRISVCCCCLPITLQLVISRVTHCTVRRVEKAPCHGVGSAPRPTPPDPAST